MRVDGAIMLRIMAWQDDNGCHCASAPAGGEARSAGDRISRRPVRERIEDEGP